MPFTAEAITLTADERAELEQMTQSRTLPAGDVFRARLVLLLAEGMPYRTIQERLSPRYPFALRRARCANRQGAGQNGSAAYQRRVRGIPGSGGRRVPAETGDPCHSG